MPLFTTDALILRTYKLGEFDRIVVFLTRDRGKRRGVAKGARRPRSRFVGGLEPLTLTRVAYFERELRDLVSLNYAEAVRSPLATRNPDSLGYVGYFAELLDEGAMEADPNERLYRLGASLVEAMADEPRIERLARYFEYWVLRLQGVYPSVTLCPGCGAQLAPRGARLVPGERLLKCRICAGAVPGPALSPEAVGFLQRAARIGPRALRDVALSRAASRELEVAHRTLIASHLDREPRSMRVVRDTR